MSEADSITPSLNRLQISDNATSNSGQGDASTNNADSTGNNHAVANSRSDSPADVPDPELLIKHPLQNSWTLWFFKNDRNRLWSDNQVAIITFNTVEDFWALYNHIELASKLSAGSDYSLFKEGIKPMWEDERNSRGGRWLINLDKKQRMTSLDNFWLEVMLCLIGESFEDHSQYVNGAVVAVRTKCDKIGMWLGDSSAAESIQTVGRRVKERLGIDPHVNLGFEAHEDTMKKSGSTAKNRYFV